MAALSLALGGCFNAAEMEVTKIAPSVWISPDVHDFGEVEKKGFSGTQQFRITNHGDTAAKGCGDPSISNTTDFILNWHNCLTPEMAPGESCVAHVQAAPQAAGVVQTALTRACEEGGTAVTGAQGIRAWAGNPSLVPAGDSGSFGAITLGVPVVRTYYFKNSGNGTARSCTPVSLNPLNAAPLEDFRIIQNDCEVMNFGVPSPIELAPGAQCLIKVETLARRSGKREARIERTCNNWSAGEQYSAAIDLGVGVASLLDIRPDGGMGGDFGDVVAGGASDVSSFVIENRSAAPFADCETRIEGTNASEFVVGGSVNGGLPSCVAALAGSSACGVSVQARPTSLGLKTALLKHTCGTEVATLLLRANGTGPARLALVAPDGLDFGAQTSGYQSQKWLILMHVGGGPARLDVAQVMPGDPFSVRGDAIGPLQYGLNCFRLYRGGSCIVPVVFQPGAAQEYANDFTINYQDGLNDGVQDEQIVVTLTGSGRAALSGSQVASGRFHNCAILSDNRLKCWGGNSSGQLGLGNVDPVGDLADHSDMGAALTLFTDAVSSVVVGDSHSCVMDYGWSYGSVRCWGGNAVGQLGFGGNWNVGDFTDLRGSWVTGLQAVRFWDQERNISRYPIKIVAGYEHTCALLHDGVVSCWGQNSSGQLGIGTRDPYGDSGLETDAPRVNLGPERRAKDVVAGAYHTCVILDDDSVKCWGLNSAGQLGLGDKLNRGGEFWSVPMNLPAVNLGTGERAVALAAGAEHTCALLSDAKMKCWGANNYGQLGLGSTLARGDGNGAMGDLLPRVGLPAGDLVAAITAGETHSCAVLETGAVKCWGRNQYGQLGLGSTATIGDGPGEVANLTAGIDFGAVDTIQLSSRALSGSGSHNCAVLDDGTVRCWGANGSFQLGLGLLATEHLGGRPGEMGVALPEVPLLAP